MIQIHNIQISIYKEYKEYQMKQSVPNYKILLIGDSTVGKTSILMQYCQNYFNNSFISTIGVDFKVKNLLIDNKKVCFNIWDTAGQQRFKNITKSFFHKSQGIALIYSITNRESFNHIQNWMQQLKSINSFSSLSLILVGNKTDLQEERKVKKQQGQTIAKKYNIKFLEVSAKDNSNLQNIFLSLGSDILYKSKNIRQQEPKSIILQSMVKKQPSNINHRNNHQNCEC